MASLLRSSPSDYYRTKPGSACLAAVEPAMRTIGDLKLIQQAVSMYETATDALSAMARNSVAVVSVLDDGRFIGVVTKDTAKAAAPDTPVRDLVKTLVIEMPAATPVRNAAEVYLQNGLDFVPVMDGDKFCGLLTAVQFLLDLSWSWDPMTALSWSDRLREWGVDQLEDGREVTVVFVDLDNFGAYNKTHGHVVGDRVLRAVAKLLANKADSNQDLLVRYGGDEFVIGSIRPRADVESDFRELAQTSVVVEGVPEKVSFTVGVAGGKRTRERERTHVASTLDNLINLASKDALARKARRSSKEQPTEKRFCNVEIEPNQAGSTALASVELSNGVFIASHPVVDNDKIAAVGMAVSRALERSRPGVKVTCQDVVLYKRWDGEPVVIVRTKIQKESVSEVVEVSKYTPSGVLTSLGEAVVSACQKSIVFNS